MLDQCAAHSTLACIFISHWRCPHATSIQRCSNICSASWVLNASGNFSLIALAQLYRITHWVSHESSAAQFYLDIFLITNWIISNCLKTQTWMVRNLVMTKPLATTVSASANPMQTSIVTWQKLERCRRCLWQGSANTPLLVKQSTPSSFAVLAVSGTSYCRH